MSILKNVTVQGKNLFSTFSLFDEQDTFRANRMKMENFGDIRRATYLGAFQALLKDKSPLQNDANIFVHKSLCALKPLIPLRCTRFLGRE